MTRAGRTLAYAGVLGYVRCVSPRRSVAVVVMSGLLACQGDGDGSSTGATAGSTSSTSGSTEAASGGSTDAASTAATTGATETGGTSEGGTSGGSASGGSTSGSETGGVRECVAHPDCPPGQVCVQSCDDLCDQSRYPNPCCERACAELSPLSCQAVGGTCAAECPTGTYPAANPDVWACGLPTGCCLPEVEACADHLHRFACESRSACVWVLADCEIENCNFPDKGTCQDGRGG